MSSLIGFVVELCCKPCLLSKFYPECILKCRACKMMMLFNRRGALFIVFSFVTLKFTLPSPVVDLVVKV